MVLALVDDLMFTSKIRAAAAQLGVANTNARSSSGALAGMREAAPAHGILDLNSTRTDPIGTVRSMKADAALAAIPTVGFVSHVDTATIDAARSAGVGEVLARSAFTTQLGEILGRGR
jgi:DNA-binding NarL/FixJ family response regulator